MTWEVHRQRIWPAQEAAPSAWVQAHAIMFLNAVSMLNSRGSQEATISARVHMHAVMLLRECQMLGM